MKKRFIEKKLLGIPVIVIICAVVFGGIGVVVAIPSFQSKTIPINGTIDITNPPPPTPDFNYTLSPNISFGATSFQIGSQVDITGIVLITNVGNQPINSLLVAGMHLPSWITEVEITQTPIPIGSAVQETVTLSGIAPSTAQTINLTGANVLSAGGITITPQS